MATGHLGPLFPANAFLLWMKYLAFCLFVAFQTSFPCLLRPRLEVLYQVYEEADALVAVDGGPRRADRLSGRRRRGTKLDLLVPERTFRLEILRVEIPARLEAAAAGLVDDGFRVVVVVVVVVGRRLRATGKTVGIDVLRRR